MESGVGILRVCLFQTAIFDEKLLTAVSYLSRLTIR